MSGSSLLLLVSLYLCLCATEAAGQAYDIGDSVLVTRNTTITYADGQKEVVFPATVLQVRNVDGTRLQVRWTRRGWIQSRGVVSSSEYGVETMRDWLEARPCTANRINFGAAQLLEGDYQAALWYFQAAHRHEPRSTWACNALGWFYASCPEDKLRDADLAIEFCERACELSHWRESMFITSLACAYAEQQDFEKAVQWIKKAILMDEKFRGFRARLLQRFENGKAYRTDELLRS